MLAEMETTIAEDFAHSESLGDGLRELSRQTGDDHAALHASLLARVRARGGEWDGFVAQRRDAARRVADAELAKQMGEKATLSKVKSRDDMTQRIASL